MYNMVGVFLILVKVYLLGSNVSDLFQMLVEIIFVGIICFDNLLNDCFILGLQSRQYYSILLTRRNTIDQYFKGLKLLNGSGRFCDYFDKNKSV